MNDMEIAELIKEAKYKSKAAEKCLFDIYAGRMLTLCRRYVKTAEDAEELMLNGFVKFFHALSTFKYENDAACYSFIKRIMINECLMFLRKQQAFKIVSETEAENIAVEEEALDLLSTKEIFELIVQLPVGYRTVFNLFVIEGMTHIEIAKELGITVGTSKSQLNKARQLLQKNIDKGNYYAKQQQQ
ncbi:MAG: sigma-70 family RNA polymerase sigma factor [Chitinophagaceae bacterium]|nr:MAG: sigma-70 family RNA polymerase sigma factor [Chitinophagaceae bacterium]